MIGKLKTVPVRELWKHEAYDFTSWLFENFEILNDQIGLTINPIEQEKSVGSFRVDILAEDLSGRAVIIENQLEKTDHDHLGKLLTYMSNLSAKIAIWISPNPRAEHVAAINFLNEVVPKDTHFYLIRLQAFSIEGSAPAPLFTIAAGPSEERTAGGNVKKEFAEQDQIRYEFFEQLLSETGKMSNIFDSISPVGYQNWVNAGAGKSGIMWSFVIMKKKARVEFFLCHSDSKINKERFDLLLTKRDEIEGAFGEPLIWDFNDTRKQQYLKTDCPYGGLDDIKDWTKIQEDMINRVIKLDKSLKPFINLL